MHSDALDVLNLARQRPCGNPHRRHALRLPAVRAIAERSEESGYAVSRRQSLDVGYGYIPVVSHVRSRCLTYPIGYHCAHGFRHPSWHDRPRRGQLSYVFGREPAFKRSQIVLHCFGT